MTPFPPFPESVRFVLAQFVDIDGVAKGKLVPISHWDDVIHPGAGFAGPSIEGTGLPRNGPRSEFYGRGDVSTARVAPWQPELLHVICDGFVGGEVFDGCSRQTLKRATARLETLGYTLNVGIEPEFFLLKRNASGQLELPDPQDTLAKPSYDLKSLLRSPVLDCLADLDLALTEYGMDVVQIDHEDSPGQYEVNFKYADALASADNLMRFKLAAHAIAEQHSLVYCGMAKPFADRPGSGLHFHLSITDRAGTAVFDNGHGGLNSLGQYALAGLLQHAAALTAIHAPTINSYKRLTAGGSQSGTTWAPVEIGWGSNNRTIPARVTAGRMEWRVPDPTCNVYLSLAAVIHAFIDGIERKLIPPAATETDAYDTPSAERRKLPHSLDAALDALAQDSALTEAIGTTICAQFIRTKRDEIAAFASRIHGWEWQQYGAKY
ncbi:MAG: type III glutamate--ammonia ligase [Betaproteobacteria bacterium]|nr:MAG: type III glutamate--ammonia ligase [Betaproteobacteria bacterium]